MMSLEGCHRLLLPVDWKEGLAGSESGMTAAIQARGGG